MLPRVPIWWKQTVFWIDWTYVHLERDISEVEIQEAMSSLAVGKSPGIDGFSIDFFKAFLPKLIDPLKDMYAHYTETQCIPETLEQAMITLLLKPGKDPCLCGSYRPISLLNSDIRENSCIKVEKSNFTIGTHQTGLNQNRSLVDNVWRLLNVIFLPLRWTSLLLLFL